jgi:hypothetical protein
VICFELSPPHDRGDTLRSVKVHAVCVAEYGEISPDWVNTRTGYRTREFDTRAVTFGRVAVPKLRSGTSLADGCCSSDAAAPSTR